jgi:hypothetical protein
MPRGLNRFVFLVLNHHEDLAQKFAALVAARGGNRLAALDGSSSEKIPANTFVERSSAFDTCRYNSGCIALDAAQ